ncbi:MAG: C10 family peptidase [Alistipes sp.]|nr:C10 family peptidase [Alistipes sp.]
MKKSFNFLICALLICTAVWSLWGCADNLSYEQEPATNNVREQLKAKLSHEVTQVEARENLEKLLLKMKIPSTRGGDAMQIPPITSVYTRGKAALATRAGEEVEPYFHIFNFGDNEGFAIMSGDDRVEPLLALTFKGELTPETEIDNPGFEIAYSRMEDYYVERIGVADTIPSIGFDDPIPPRDSLPSLELPVRETQEDTLIYHTMKYGYCPVKWGQGHPYNSYCYTDNNEIAKTGCVATAVAQLMAIYQYPNTYNGYSFNWTEMRKSSPNATGTDQIARLMQQLGLSNNLDMNYGVSSSGASPSDIARTLRNFGYASGGQLIDYDAGQVYSELRNGYPVLLGGNDGDSGHRWLTHGLMELRINYRGYNELDEVILSYSYFQGYYFLNNWGWNGNCDGFFLSEIFAPYSLPDYPDPTRSVDPYNYQNNVTAVVGIRKY